MIRRTIPILALALGILLLAGRQAGAEQEKPKPANAQATHVGKVVNLQANKLTMVDRDGKQQHTHTLAPNARITLDGREARPDDLKPGMFIRVTTAENDRNTAVRIEASTKVIE